MRTNQTTCSFPPHYWSKCALTCTSNSAVGICCGNFVLHIGQTKHRSSLSWAAMCSASSESESKISLHCEHGLWGSPGASTNLQQRQQCHRLTIFPGKLLALKYINIMYNKVGRAPTALNFADDTGWDTDWLRLERAWAPKRRMLSSENGNKKHPINHYAVVVVDFCVENAFLSRLQCSNHSLFSFFNWLSPTTWIEYCRSLCLILCWERIGDFQGRD